MKDLAPYAGIAPEVNTALVALETAQAFDADAYRIVRREADRRIPLFFALVAPALAVGAALVWIAQVLRWLPAYAPWAYGLFPFVFMVLVMWPVRGNAARDDARIGKALQKWRPQAVAAGIVKG